MRIFLIFSQEKETTMNPITNIPDTCVVLDTETTGFETDDGHRLVEIGAIKMIDGLPSKETFHVYINPERTVPEAAAEVHGLTLDRLKDEPKFKEIAKDFLAFIGDLPLVAHNAKFDMKFINFELELAGFETTEKNRWIDSVSIARKLFPGSPANLDALCRRFKISLDGRSKHGALIDTELLADVLVEMGGGRQQSLFGLISDDTTSSNDTTKEALPTRTTTIESTLDDADVEAHKAFVFEQLGEDSLWAQYYKGTAA